MEHFSQRRVDGEIATRQVTEVQAAGDFVNLDALLLRQIDHNVVALTACTMGFTPNDHLHRVIEQAPTSAGCSGWQR